MMVCGMVVFCTLMLPILGDDAENRSGKPHGSKQPAEAYQPRRPRSTQAEWVSPGHSDKDGPKRKGTITAHKDSYGFLRVPEGAPDWFFHCTELSPGFSFPVGCEVEFTVGKDSFTGRTLATKLVPVNMSNTPAIAAEGTLAVGGPPMLPLQVSTEVSMGASTSLEALAASSKPGDRWNRWGDEPVNGSVSGSASRSWRQQASKKLPTNDQGQGPAVGTSYVPFHLRGGASIGGPGGRPATRY